MEIIDIIVTENEGMLTLVDMETFKVKELLEHQLDKVYKNKRFETADIRMHCNFSIICYDLEYIYYVLNGKVKRVSLLEKEKAIEIVRTYSTARFTGVNDFETARETSKKRYSHITSVEKAMSILYNNVLFRLGENTYSEAEKETPLERLVAKKKLVGFKDEGYEIIGESAVLKSQMSVEFIKIPWGVKSVIVEGDMAYNQELRVLVLPETVDYMSDSLGKIAGYLRYINIPERINKVPRSLFKYAPNIMQIENAEQIDNWDEEWFISSMDLRYANFSSCKETPKIRFHNERQDDGEEWID